MNKKYLVVCGDSFTSGHNMGEVASWAYWVAKELNLELINLSFGGMGNEWISNTLLSYLNTTDIPLEECVVMVGWSDLARQLVFMDKIGEEECGTFSLVPGDLLQQSDSIETDGRLKWIWENKTALYPFFSNIQWYLFKTYQSMFYTKMFLENKKIPFLFFDSITDNKVYYKDKLPYIKNTWKDFNQTQLEELDIHDDVIANQISEKIVNFIFDENYITFDGNTIMGWLQQEGNFKYEEGNEGHTNIIGAQKISEYIIKKYKK